MEKLIVSKAGNFKHRTKVSLITGSMYFLLNNLYAIAETAVVKTEPKSTTTAATATTASSSLPLVIGLLAIIIIATVIFLMTRKKDSKMQMPGSNKITPPQPGARPAVTPSAPKTPVATPPKTPVVTPVTPPKIDNSLSSTPNSEAINNSSQKIEMPVANSPVPSTPVMTPPPAITPQPMPSMSTNNEAKPLFDAGKLDNDLDNIFNDPSAPPKPEQEDKKAPLFDSNQLDDDLDALFVEVNKKPDQPKEEKKGLFDSNQLSSDLDNLFSEGPTTTAQTTPDKSSDNLADLFNSPAAPIETASATQPQSTFSLDDLNFLSTETKKEEEPKNDSFALPSLDLSSLTGGNADSKNEPAKETSTFDLNDLNFLSTETKKEEEPKNDSFSLPSFNLSDLTGKTESSTPTPPPSNDKIDLTTTTMGLNISDYLNSMQKTEKKEGFSLSNTIPPHSLNINDLNIESPVSKNTVEETKSSDSGVISIGKMLVDQNALEEIIKKAEKGGKAGLTTTQVITAVKGRSLDTLLVDINNVDGILGSIIVGKDGLVIANTMPENIDKDLVGALTSSLFTNIDTQVKKLKKGNLKRVTVETLSGIYILTEIEMGTLVVFGSDGKKVNLSDIYKAITAVTGKK